MARRRKADAKTVKARIAAAAERASAEAEERRRAAGAAEARPAERGGRAGPEPTRYGDWEKKGLIADF